MAVVLSELAVGCCGVSVVVGALGGDDCITVVTSADDTGGGLVGMSPCSQILKDNMVEQSRSLLQVSFVSITRQWFGPSRSEPGGHIATGD